MWSWMSRTAALTCAAAIAAAGCGGGDGGGAGDLAADPPAPSGRAVELRTTFHVGRDSVFVRVPVPIGWTAPAGEGDAAPPLVELRRDVAPDGCGQIVAIFVVRPDQLREFEPRVRGPVRGISVRLDGDGRRTTVDASVRHSGALFDRGPDSTIIGNGSAVSIAEVRARGLPPIRIVGSGFGGGGGCKGGAPAAGAAIDGALRTVNAGLALRLARRGRGYAIVTSRER